MPNAYGIAFLTFDDWGTDVYVTKLLEVLRKHNVKATFFVRIMGTRTFETMCLRARIASENRLCQRAADRPGGCGLPEKYPWQQHQLRHTGSVCGRKPGRFFSKP